MQRRWRFVAALALAVPALMPSVSPATAMAIRSGSVTGWVPYWETTEGIEAIHASGQSMTEVMPFWFTAKSATNISQVASGNFNDVVAAARARGMLVIPSVTDGTGKLVMQSILLDASKRAAHVNALVNLVVSRSFDGIDLDYEGFAFADGKGTWPQTQPVWQQFVQELATALHAQGKLLSVTVPPMWTDTKGEPVGYPIYFPTTGSWASLTSVVDRLRLMVYDWSVASPGPIAPLSWVNNVVSFVQKMVPATDLGKVWLGVPAYGRSWAQVTGECPAVLPSGVTRSTVSVPSESGATLAASHGATTTRVEGEQTFSWFVGEFTGLKTITPVPDPYAPTGTVANEIPKVAEGALVPAVRLRPSTVNVTCKITRVVYVPDNQSIVERSQIAQAAGLGGIVVWALGYESNDLWSTLASS